MALWAACWWVQLAASLLEVAVVVCDKRCCSFCPAGVLLMLAEACRPAALGSCAKRCAQRHASSRHWGSGVPGDLHRPMLPSLVLHGTKAALSGGTTRDCADHHGGCPVTWAGSVALPAVAQQQSSGLSHMDLIPAAWHACPLQATALQCGSLTFAKAAIHFRCLRRLLALGILPFDPQCCLVVLASPATLSWTMRLCDCRSAAAWGRLLTRTPSAGG